MSEQSIVEKAARAACAADNSGQHEFDATGLDASDPEYQPEWKFYVAGARAVIEALMDPTPEMVEALNANCEHKCQPKGDWASPVDAFRAALQVALNEREGE